MSCANLFYGPTHLIGLTFLLETPSPLRLLTTARVAVLRRLQRVCRLAAFVLRGRYVIPLLSRSLARAVMLVICCVWHVSLRVCTFRVDIELGLMK